MSRFISLSNSQPLANYDVIIVGAGVVGSALAFELSQYPVKICLIDQKEDVGDSTSKGNSGIVHTGFDSTPGTLESKLITDASKHWPEVSRQLKIPYMQTGAILVALNEEQKNLLPTLYQKALKNGVKDVELISAQEAVSLEPNISPKIKGGLYIPRESVGDPFTAVHAYTDCALANGIDLYLGTRVNNINTNNSKAPYIVSCSSGFDFTAPIIINVAGLGSRQLADTYEGDEFHINPRRGQILIYDKLADLVNRIVLPVPTAKTKGMLISPTIFGNTLVGPTAEDFPLDNNDYSNTTPDGITSIKESTLELCPSLANYHPICSYAGLRCNCDEGSYRIKFDDGNNIGILTVTGIRSTGFTASLSLAKYLVSEIQNHYNIPTIKKPDALFERSSCSWPPWYPGYETSEKSHDDPTICFCEKITKQQIFNSLNTPTQPSSLDAIKRRTRATAGRCQGFNCAIPTSRLIAAHLNIPLHKITKKGEGSEYIAENKNPGTNIPPYAKYINVPSEIQQVAIIGSGPSGIGMAYGLTKYGIKSMLIERYPLIGGIPNIYSLSQKHINNSFPSFLFWPSYTGFSLMKGNEYRDHLDKKLQKSNCSVLTSTNVIGVDDITSPTKIISLKTASSNDVIKLPAESIVFATGSREMNLTERGVCGHRPSGIFYSNHIHQMAISGHFPLALHPAIISQDISISRILSSSLNQSITKDIQDIIYDPESPLFSAIYSNILRIVAPFLKAPTSRSSPIILNSKTPHYEIIGGFNPKQFAYNSKDSSVISCDSILLFNQLISNSELLIESNFPVDSLNRRPILSNFTNSIGCFAVGNVLGRSQFGHSCFLQGYKYASKVASFLRKTSFH